MHGEQSLRSGICNDPGLHMDLGTCPLLCRSHLPPRVQTRLWLKQINETGFVVRLLFYNLVTKTENIFVAGAHPIIFHGLMSWGGALFRGGGHG